MSILALVREFIREHGLLTGGDGVVVGVSGGPDSLCLLHVLLMLQEEMALRLHVAHLDHGARGEEADADAAYVADLARTWGLPVTVAKRDVPAVAQARKLAFEEAARRVRYAFLARLASETGAAKVAVGHNADDQAETVLMHLLRGAGPAGLRGMLPATPLRAYRMLEEIDGFSPPPHLTLIRPLLAIPRADVEEYCTKLGLEPRFDRSNLDTTYFRNRLRHKLLPVLESYNPNIRPRLRHTAEVIAADYGFLTQARDRAWDEAVREETEEAIVFDHSVWQALHLSLQRALIREAAYRLRRQLRDVSFVHVEDAVRVARQGRTGAQATLPEGLSLTVGYDQLTIADAGYEPRLEGPSLQPGQEVTVAMPGATLLPVRGWLLEATLPESWSLPDVEANPDRWTAYLDVEALAPPLTLRTRRPGDRFRPQGMRNHTPRLADWMINAKVPRWWRDQLPLLVAGEEIVWVCGWRVSETALVTPTTHQAVQIRFHRAGKEA